MIYLWLLSYVFDSELQTQHMRFDTRNPSTVFLTRVSQGFSKGVRVGVCTRNACPCSMGWRWRWIGACNTLAFWWHVIGVACKRTIQRLDILLLVTTILLCKWIIQWMRNMSALATSFSASSNQQKISGTLRSGSSDGSSSDASSGCEHPELNSDSGTDDSSSNSGSDVRSMRNVDLSLLRLQSLHATCSHDDVKETKYAQQGYSKERIKQVLSQNICDCGCKVPPKLLMSLCRTFWSLPKASQDALLWSLQLETSSSSKRTWSLGGPTPELAFMYLQKVYKRSHRAHVNAICFDFTSVFSFYFQEWKCVENPGSCSWGLGNNVWPAVSAAFMGKIDAALLVLVVP